MSQRPRFTIELSVRDNLGPDKWTHAIGCDNALSISNRVVDEVKLGLVGSFSDTVQILRQKQMRRDILIRAAEQLAAQMADRLEDSEGWHDPSRVDPAKRALGR